MNRQKEQFSRKKKQKCSRNNSEKKKKKVKMKNLTHPYLAHVSLLESQIPRE